MLLIVQKTGVERINIELVRICPIGFLFIKFFIAYTRCLVILVNFLVKIAFIKLKLLL